MNKSKSWGNLAPQLSILLNQQKKIDHMEVTQSLNMVQHKGMFA
jgi:hypothetical protein